MKRAVTQGAYRSHTPSVWNGLTLQPNNTVRTITDHHPTPSLGMLYCTRQCYTCIYSAGEFSDSYHDMEAIAGGGSAQSLILTPAVMMRRIYTHDDHRGLLQILSQSGCPEISASLACSASRSVSRAQCSLVLTAPQRVTHHISTPQAVGSYTAVL